MGARKNRLYTLEKNKQNRDLSYGQYRSKISLQTFGQSLDLSRFCIINNDIYIGLFQKKIIFLVRKFQKFCVWLLTLYAFIICQVIIRTQYYTNASLISAPVVILYQNVKNNE